MLTSPLLLALLENAQQKPTYMNEAAKTDDNDNVSEPEDIETEDEDNPDEADDEATEDTTDSENEDTEDDFEEDEDVDYGFDSDEDLGASDMVADDTDEEDEPEETNVQTNVLNISELDRNLVKRRLFNNYKDLRTAINSFKMTVTDREESLPLEIRSAMISRLGDLYEKITEYMMYKFSYTNYEENLEIFTLYTKKFNEIIQVALDDDKHDNKGTHRKPSSKKVSNKTQKQRKDVTK